MKIAINIFAFYLLSLAMVPCSDGGSGILERINHLIGLDHQEHSDHQQHSNSCGDDACSPFCFCACCASVIDFPEKVQLFVRVPQPIPGERPGFHTAFTPTPFITQVWQPPNRG